MPAAAASILSTAADIIAHINDDFMMNGVEWQKLMINDDESWRSMMITDDQDWYDLRRANEFIYIFCDRQRPKLYHVFRIGGTTNTSASEPTACADCCNPRQANEIRISFWPRQPKLYNRIRRCIKSFYIDTTQKIRSNHCLLGTQLQLLPSRPTLKKTSITGAQYLLGIKL